MEEVPVTTKGSAFTLSLPPEAHARLTHFKESAIFHPVLEQVDSHLVHAILEPAGFAHVLLYGPSGAGKSTLVRQVAKRLNQAMKTPSDGRNASLPILLVETRPADGELFNRTDYYRTALRTLGESSFERRFLVDIGTDQMMEKKRAGRPSTRYQDSPELRHALEDALSRHDVRAVILDEAQHLMQASNGAKLVDQLNWIKSMTNVTGVVHVLLGTYDLLAFRNLSGQTARRGLDIHFPRYQWSNETDRFAFQNALLTLLKQVPCSVDIEVLMQQWGYFYERSIGCIGVLKEWLVRATALALREGNDHLLLAHLQKRALSDAQCERMALEAKSGEDELRYTDQHHAQLLRLLGMSPSAQSSPGSLMKDAALPALTKTTTRRVGERAPTRDPVGEAASEEKSSKCSFTGRIDLEAELLLHSGLSKVECPECGAVRTIRVSTTTVLFPSHPRRLTRGPSQERRWMRQGTNWQVSEKLIAEK